MGGVFDSLYEVHHAGLSVSHLPVKGQGLQAVVTGKRAPCAEIHVAVGLGVAGHCFPPVCSLSGVWRSEQKDGSKGETGRNQGRQSEG